MTREEAIEVYHGLISTKIKEAFEFFAPELRESDDERIRKWIIGYAKGQIDGFLLVDDEECNKIANQWRKAITYLEKQKYDRMKPIYDARESFESALEKAWKDYNDSGARTVDGCEDDYVECAHAKGFREGYLFGLEKQKEEGGYEAIPVESTLEYKLGFKAGKESEKQKEPENVSASTMIPSFWRDENGEPKYKKEDYFCERCQANAFNAGRESVLKKPVEWSEKEYGRLFDIEHYLDGTLQLSPDRRIACIDFLKSLRPSWKPSEEQMSALYKCFQGTTYDDALESLYEQLQKLKGGVAPMKDIDE